MKIYVTGCVASGKTTLAARMAVTLGVPHYELDCVIHAESPDGRYKRTPEQQREEIRRIDRTGGWIIEGTYRESCR